jgi:hypothetical protein
MVAPPIPPEPIKPPEPLDRVSMPASRSPDDDEPPHPLAAPNSNRIAGHASERIELETARVARASHPRRSRAARPSGNPRQAATISLHPLQGQFVSDLDSQGDDPMKSSLVASS